MSSTSLFDTEEPLSVSDLVQGLRDLVEVEYSDVWVAGELSGLARPSSGHWYFSLKDAAAQIRCVMYRGATLRIKFDPRNGLEVLARGRATVYGAKGELQINVSELQPKGLGAAELALRQLKEKLLLKGYFDPRRKRKLPRFPRRIGIVTSATGAAVRDMVELLSQRWPLAEVIVRSSRVQGDGAGAEVAAAIRMLNRLHASRELPIDAIVIGRGGGSTEDLWAFNEEVVADAVFESAVPVVSAVGHEIDVTVADLVADHRAETPSAAVVALTPNGTELMAAILEQHRRLFEAVEHRLQLARQRVNHLAERSALRRPLQRIRDLEQRLDGAAERLHRVASQKLVQATEKLSALSARLETLSPLNVLTRGYSLTHTADGKLVHSARDVKPGDELVTRVADGTIRSRVSDSEMEIANAETAISNEI